MKKTVVNNIIVVEPKLTAEEVVIELNELDDMRQLKGIISFHGVEGNTSEDYAFAKFIVTPYIILNEKPIELGWCDYEYYSSIIKDENIYCIVHDDKDDISKIQMEDTADIYDAIAEACEEAFQQAGIDLDEY